MMVNFIENGEGKILAGIWSNNENAKETEVYKFGGGFRPITTCVPEALIPNMFKTTLWSLHAAVGMKWEGNDKPKRFLSGLASVGNRGPHIRIVWFHNVVYEAQFFIIWLPLF